MVGAAHRANMLEMFELTDSVPCVTLGSCVHADDGEHSRPAASATRHVPSVAIPDRI